MNCLENRLLTFKIPSVSKMMFMIWSAENSTLREMLVLFFGVKKCLEEGMIIETDFKHKCNKECKKH